MSGPVVSFITCLIQSAFRRSFPKSESLLGSHPSHLNSHLRTHEHFSRSFRRGLAFANHLRQASSPSVCHARPLPPIISHQPDRTHQSKVPYLPTYLHPPPRVEVRIHLHLQLPPQVSNVCSSRALLRSCTRSSCTLHRRLVPSNPGLLISRSLSSYLPGPGPPAEISLRKQPGNNRLSTTNFTLSHIHLLATCLFVFLACALVCGLCSCVAPRCCYCTSARDKNSLQSRRLHVSRPPSCLDWSCNQVILDILLDPVASPRPPPPAATP